MRGSIYTYKSVSKFYIFFQKFKIYSVLYDSFEGILYKSLKFASKDKKEDVI